MARYGRIYACRLQYKRLNFLWLLISIYSTFRSIGPDFKTVVFSSLFGRREATQAYHSRRASRACVSPQPPSRFLHLLKIFPSNTACEPAASLAFPPKIRLFCSLLLSNTILQFLCINVIISYYHLFSNPPLLN